MTNQNQQATGQWAQQQKEGMKRQDEKATAKEARRVVEGGEADKRSQQGQNKQQGIVRDDRGQTQPTDKKRAQNSQNEGPAAYAPLPDEQSSADEARQSREKEQRQEKHGGR
jgi:hypothetical protein